MLSHWHPKSERCSAPVCVLWLCDCQWLPLPKWTILFQFIPWDSFHEIVILMLQLRLHAPYNFILRGQQFYWSLFKHCWWIFNSSFFCKYFILYFDLSLSFFNTPYLLLLFRLSVKIHVPISLNFMAYVYICMLYTLQTPTDPQMQFRCFSSLDPSRIHLSRTSWNPSVLFW